MKNRRPLKSASRTLVLALAALAPFLLGQVNAAPASSNQATNDTRLSSNSDSAEPGTIPAARQTPPQSVRGAEGPIRTDLRGRAASDPSIRDNNPLTVNGLWETMPGNVVTRPRLQ